jgi:hypothetical protein
VETILVIMASWWWVAPAAAGVGAMSYAGLTARGRRARRLELDAARHEERTAYRALQSAQADLRAAKAEVLVAKTRRDPSGVRAYDDARRRLADIKLAERSAALKLRATRGRLKASVVRYRTTTRGAPLPIEELVARHDAVTAKWLEYETDAGKALSFPQMLDPQHPPTLAFLRAQREAQTLRAEATQDKVTPATFLAYRDAVQAAEAAFAAAEADAHGIARESVSSLSWDALPTPLTTWLPRAADAIGEAARVVADVRDAVAKRQGGTGPRTDEPPRG